MLEFDSFMKAAEHCAELALAQHEADHRALDRATKFLQKKVQEKFGEYQEQAGQFVAWAELTDATQADRERHGYAPDEPLERTGATRESIDRAVHEKEGYVGSDSDILVYQELGTKFMPPRSTLGGAAVENAEKIAKICGQAVVMSLVGEHVFNGAIDIDEWSANP